MSSPPRRRPRDMFKDTKAFSGFAAPDVEAAQRFYADTLGIETSVEYGLLTLHLAGGARPTLVYPKPDHTPASYTILNFPVDDIDAAVDALLSRGVDFERYDGFGQDAKGGSRQSGGPPHPPVRAPPRANPA